MKKRLFFICILLLSGCNHQSDIGGGNKMIDINIRIDGQHFLAKLYDNKTTQELMELFPITITMDDLNRNEKYHYLNQSLAVDSESLRKIQSGDIMLFSSNCLVIFYKDFKTSYSYTRLGYIEDRKRFKEVIENGSVEVRLEVNQ